MSNLNIQTVKINFLILILLILSGPPAYAKYIILNKSMSEQQALQCPYSTSSLIDESTGDLIVTFDLNIIEISEFVPIPGTYICSIPGIGLASAPELPQVPALTLNYNIPSQDLCKITITDSLHTSLNIKLAPGETPAAILDFISNDIAPIKPYAGYAPAENFSELPIQLFKGIPIHQFIITPIRYNYTKESISICNSFTAKVSFTSDVCDLEASRSEIFKYARSKQLEGKVQNLFSLNDGKYQPIPRERTQDYLIITNR